MIAIDQHPPVGHAMFRQMREAAFGELATKHLDRRLVGDLAKRDEHARIGQDIDLAGQERAAAMDFLRRRLVLGRQAFDRIADDHVVERQPVIGSRLIGAAREAELGQRREQQVAGIIAGERPTGAVGAVLARRKPDDAQPAMTSRCIAGDTWQEKSVVRQVKTSSVQPH